MKTKIDSSILSLAILGTQHTHLLSFSYLLTYLLTQLTSVQVAYHLISPLLGAAKADIWRYAVLWLYGGVYLDYDSDIKTLFDDIISNDDEVILSEEGINYEGLPTHSLIYSLTYSLTIECYLTSSHLSNNATFSKHNNYKQILDTTKFIDGLDR